MKRAIAFMFLALALGSTFASSASAGEVPIVFVRFHEGTIADPGPGSMDTVWVLEDFDLQYQQLLGRAEAAGVTGLRPIGIAWRHLDLESHPRMIDFSTVYAAQLGPLADPLHVAEVLTSFEEVVYAEVPGQGTLFDDRYTDDQWWMENTGQTTANCYPLGVYYCTDGLDPNIPNAWCIADSSDALVGILDSGVYTNGSGTPANVDLSGTYNGTLSRDYTGYGMDDTNSIHHGTKVAGLVAGSGENYTDYQGVVGFTSPSGWDPLVVYRIGMGSGVSEECSGPGYLDTRAA